jgi:hypothetical protein
MIRPPRIGVAASPPERRFAPTASALLFLVVGGSLTGCDIREAGLAERCADVMRQAFPGGGIEIRSMEAQAVMSSGIARVDGVREKVAPDGGVLRDVAVECRFEDGVLTGFRWIAGPLH